MGISSDLEAQVASIHNIRDLHQACPSVQPGRIIRCATPGAACNTDVDLLLNALSVKDLLDLRSEDEIQEDREGSQLFSKTVKFTSHKRSWWPKKPSQNALDSSNDGLMHHHIPLLNKSMFFPTLLTHVPLRSTLTAAGQRLRGDRDAARQTFVSAVNKGGLPMYYQMLLDGSKPEILTALTLITLSLKRRRTVMLFCKVGKDRTGIISALVLHCAGASQEEIANDYAKSDKYHMVALAGLEKLKSVQGLNHSSFARAPKEVMQATLAYLDQRYEGVTSYLTHIGFNEQMQKQLRELLVS